MTARHRHTHVVRIEIWVHDPGRGLDREGEQAAWTFSISTRRDQSFRPATTGMKARSPSGTIGRPGTMRATTIGVSVV
jgi:hypothetical protein